MVLDIMMPVLDGWFVLAELGGRADAPVRRGVLGEVERRATATRAKELSADEYVTKPFEPDDLVAVIRDVLGRRAAVRARRPPTPSRVRAQPRPLGRRSDSAA